ncbi:hypothetical protein [Sphingomonas crusticola]|uniref:hypothetical protein n=1 Tax=Sphingomonas crusticola TaxID=1697973 RepID=UPI0013C368CB|nr:hypothetical protein [Sphingomonas crusticola]
MAVFPRPAHPRAVIADVRRLWSTSTRRYKLVFGAAAIGVTSLLITIFILESRWGVLPEGPQVVYVSDWPVTRTDAEIKAQQRIDATEKRKLADERRRQWQKVDRNLDRLGF